MHPADPQITETERRLADRRLHLDHLQGVIGRLSQLQFTMKGFAITLASAVLALLANHPGYGPLIFSLLAVLIFAGLDAWLLTMEIRFRDRFEEIATRWDGQPVSLSLSACLKPPIGPVEVARTVRRRFGLISYGALIIALVIGWCLLSPKCGDPDTQSTQHRPKMLDIVSVAT